MSMIHKDKFNYNYIEYFRSDNASLRDANGFIHSLYDNEIINSNEFRKAELGDPKEFSNNLAWQDASLSILENVSINCLVDKNGIASVETTDGLNRSEILEFLTLFSHYSNPGSTFIFYENVYSDAFFRCTITGPDNWYFEQNVDAFNYAEMAHLLIRAYGENFTLKQVIKAYNFQKSLR